MGRTLTAKISSYPKFQLLSNESEPNGQNFSKRADRIQS